MTSFDRPMDSARHFLRIRSAKNGTTVDQWSGEQQCDARRVMNWNTFGHMAIFLELVCDDSSARLRNC